METLGAMDPTPSLDTGGAPTSANATSPVAPQMMLLDFFFPGFSVFSAAVQKYLHIDLNLYIPLVLLFGGLTFAWQYLSEYIWGLVETYLMSVVDIRTDDEIYSMLMAWVAAQRFAQRSRRFVVNTNLSSRSWFLFRWNDDDDDEGSDDDGGSYGSMTGKKRALAYTPTFGSHYFWYKGRLLVFRRSQNQAQSGYMLPSEREEISISCFGRNPWVLKELLHEARESYIRRDEAKTLIYRGTLKSGGDPSWQRCMARTSRPFSTVILNEKVKKELIDDVTDYLDPATRRWYSNRGIPYRRGYLLHGPPGTGKSSLSLALAGFFKMRIYIVSLSSVTASEEILASLFAELPRRCVVLLEDIDSAGLTHTRDDTEIAAALVDAPKNKDRKDDMVPGQVTAGVDTTTIVPAARLSLSGLLNILDGVASQEGRVLIMTTNHIEKLDKALIRPGRVDMIVKFDRADSEMTAAIFRAIFAPLEGDDAPVLKRIGEKYADIAQALEAERKQREEAARKKEETLARIESLAVKFAARIPAHEFSPAEIQGWLLKNKRDPEAAVEGAENWVENARKEKKNKEKEEAEEKRKKEEAEEKRKKAEEEEKQKKEEEDKKKQGEEKAKKEDEGTKKKRSKKESKQKSSKKSSRRKGNSKKDESDASSSSESSSSESESEADASDADSAETKKRREPKKSGEERSECPAPVVAPVVVEPPASLKSELSNKTVVPEVDGGDNKLQQLESRAEEGRQKGADSGYGTP